MANQELLDPADRTPPEVLAVIADNVKAYPKDSCIPCGAVIHMGFFFDGFGRHRDHDDPATSRYSNICRLWEAHRDNLDPLRKDMPSQFWYRLYYSGLGTELNEEARNAEVVSALTKLGKESAKAASKRATDTAKKITGVDRLAIKPRKAVSDGIKDGLEAFSVRPVVKAFNELVEKTAALPANVGRVVTMAKDDRWVRRGRAATRAMLYEAKNHPVKAGYAVAKDLFVGFALDTIPWFRDNAAVARVIGTGVEDRLAAALKQFENAYKDTKAAMPTVQRIQVSVFGADRGAVLARAFVNALVEKYKLSSAVDLAIVDERLSKKCPIEIKFLGLLDAVSSLIEENKLINMIPVLNLVKQNYGEQKLAVPEAVQRCVHFAAAHELRFYQRLDSLEKTRGVQYLYPGTSEDITGGAPPGTLGARAELQRVVLRDMLHEAISMGVVVDTMEGMLKRKGQTFSKFTLAAPLSDGNTSYKILDLIEAYREVVPYVSRLNFLDHMKVFLRWIAMRYQSPAFRASITNHVDAMQEQHRRLLHARQQAQAAYDAARNRFPPVDLRTLVDAQSRLDAANAAEDAALRATRMEMQRPFVSVWTRIQQESSELMHRASSQDGLQRSADRVRSSAGSGELPWDADPETSAQMIEAAMLTPEQVALAQAWQEGLSGTNPLPPKVVALFDLLVHDTMLTSWHDHVLSATLYFQTRATDTFGRSDYIQEEKRRTRDEKAAARIDQQGRAMTPAARAPGGI